MRTKTTNWIHVALAAVLALAAPGCSSLPIPGPEPFDCADVAALGATQHGQTAPLYRVESASAGRYIVTLRDAPHRAAPAAVEELVINLAGAYGMSDVETFAAVNQFAAEIGSLSIEALRSDARVLFVEEDGFKSIWALPWGLDRIDQRQRPLDGVAEFAGDGAGVHVYVVDTGVSTDHPEFAGRVGERYSVFDDHVQDDHGHGTHVAGTAAGSTVGVARAAIVHPVRVLRNGSGQDSWVIEGIEWATAHAVENGWPAVINMSLGGDTSRSLDTAICRSIAKGVVHVVAAGNDDRDACAFSPAHVAQAYTIAATNRDDGRAFFSNKGACVDLFAPGQDIESAWPGGGRRTISGTSMASPHAAGAVAVLLAGGAPAEALVTTATPDVVDGEAGAPDLLVYAGGAP